MPIAVIMVLLLFGMGASLAQPGEDGAANAGRIQVRLEGSLSQKTGNTDKLIYSYGLNLSTRMRGHTLAGGIRGESSKNKGKPKDVDNLRIDLMDNWRLADALEPYAKATYYRNEIWGFRDQVRAGLGLVQGWWFGKHGPAFQTRIGYQFRWNRFTALWDQTEGTKPGERQHCVLMGFRTRAPVMRNITLSLSGDYEPIMSEGDNYYADLGASLIFVVNDRVSLITSHDLNYQRIPVPGKKQRNTESSVRLSFTI